MQTNDNNVKFDFSENVIHYRPEGHHTSSVTLTQEHINQNPGFLDSLTGKMAYSIGVFLSAKATGKLTVKEIKPQYKFLLLFGILFAVMMIISDLLGSKLFSLFGYTITGAMLIYPFTYILYYIIADVYGYRNARRVLLSTLLTLILGDMAILLLLAAPPSPYWHLQEQFQVVFERIFRTWFASTVAAAFSFFISSYILQKMKVRSRHTSFFKRVFTALFFSEMLDTTLFCLIAFTGIWPLKSMLLYIPVSYSTRVVYELIMYKIVTKPIIVKIKDLEQLDIVDYNTNFNPFSWEADYTEENNQFGKTAN